MSKDRVYTILFENCETVTIPEIAIISFTADGVTESYQSNGPMNSCDMYKEANRVQIVVSLDYLNSTNSSNLMFAEGCTLKERLGSGDIVSIETPDGVDIHVPWKEDEPQSDYLNGTQKTEVVNYWLKPDKDGEYLSIIFSYSKNSNEEDEDTDDCYSSKDDDDDDDRLEGVKFDGGIRLASNGKSKPLQDIIKDINLRIDSISAKVDSNTTKDVYAYKLKSSSKDSLQFWARNPRL